MALKTKVIIDGVTIRDDSVGNPKLVVNWEYERTNMNEISILNITVLKNTVDIVDLTIGKTVEIFSGFATSTDKKVFSGFISKPVLNGGVYEIECKDKMWDLVRRNVNKIYEITGPEGGNISLIAKDLIETFGGLTAEVEDTGTEQTRILNEFRCTQTDIYERLRALAKSVNYQIVYDAETDKVKFQSFGFINNGTTLTVKQEIISLPNWDDDDSKMVNDLRIDGAVSESQLRLPFPSGAGEIGTTTDFNTDGIILPKTPENVELIIDASNPPTTLREGGSEDGSSGNFYFIDRTNSTVKPVSGSSFNTGDFAIVNYSFLAPSPIHQTNSESIDTFGKYEEQRTLSDIVTIADAEARTSEILAKFSTPFKIGTFITKADIDISVGETVTVIDTISKPNINQSFVITKQTLKYPGSSQEIIVGDETLRLADWQFNVEDRLKRLEEQNLKNQDLLQEILTFLLTVEVEPRYRKVLKQEYDNASGVSILGLGSADGYFDLGSGKMGTRTDAFLDEEDHFIEQFNNIYNEEFVDEDFREAGGEATWDTINNKLIFD